MNARQTKKRNKSRREKESKRNALKWLGYLRDGTDQYDSFFRYFRMEVSKGKFSLADIGTREKELEQLRVKGCVVAALKYLDYLRSGTDQYDLFLKEFRMEVSKGKFSLADIGTSEEELGHLRIKGCRGTAKERPDRLRTGANSRKDVVGIFVEALKGDLTLGGIGTSERELFMNFLGSD